MAETPDINSLCIHMVTKACFLASITCVALPEALEQAIALALATITVSDAHHWFLHCGYTLQ